MSYLGRLYIIFFILFGVFSTKGIAQYRVKLEIKNILGEPISDVYVSIKKKEGEKERMLISNIKGEVTFFIEKRKFIIEAQHTSYNFYKKSFFIVKDSVLKIQLKDKLENLQEVIITAKESGKFTATSVIKKTAMNHLQPSSFSDLLSLIPGGITSSPNLNSANHIILREAGILSSDYNTSSLGTQFVIDDIPINVDANMQKTIGYQMIITPSSGYVDSRRNSVRSGVDMRSISTDNIEKVEIIRGIPSVKYGDLTSGLVKIERKKGFTQWSSRLKVDGFSKLFYVGKGFNLFKNTVKLNIDLDYLDAKPDPRNDFENYKRYTASVRMENKLSILGNPSVFKVNLDYTQSVDEEKTNPDATFKKYESYISSYKRVRFSNFLDVSFNTKFLKSLHFKMSYNQSKDKIEQTKWMQISSASALPVNTTAGEHYGIFSNPSYVSNLLIDGNPIDFYTNLFSNLQFSIKNIKNQILIGTSYTYSKNNGKGQVYDLKQPPSPNLTVRPRAFKEIPSLQKLFYYVENKASLSLQDFKLSLRVGVRGTTLLNLDKKYSMSKKVYWAPRLNATVTLPKIDIYNEPLQVSIISGWGKHFKTPTQSMIYPQDLFYDFVQLNYYHNNKEYRQVHFKTYKFSQVNYKIKLADNYKKEISVHFNYVYNNFSITYFEENMDSGFRKMSDFSPVTYKEYDVSKLNHITITKAPKIEDLPFNTKNAIALFSKETNGSTIYKRGIEFQFSGKRLQGINTRFTMSGAWFKTIYSNSLPVYRFARKMTVNGRKYYNLGVYEDEDSYVREQFSTSLIADTYIPSLGLKTSLTTDFFWFYIKKEIPQNGMPTHYVDESGQIHKYGKQQLQDPILQGLYIDYNQNINKTRRTPFSANVHLKITKNFYKNFNVSMYVNKLFNFYKDKYVDGVKIERKGLVSPYFGMEMNINF